MAWGGTYPTFLLKVERAQRAILKVMLKKPYMYPTDTLYQETELLTVRQLFIQHIILRKHQNLPYQPELDNLRRRTRICPTVIHNTKLAGRHYEVLANRIYSRVNKILHIYPLTCHKVKKIIINWLITLGYDKTENLLKSLL